MVHIDNHFNYTQRNIARFNYTIIQSLQKLIPCYFCVDIALITVLILATSAVLSPNGLNSISSTFVRISRIILCRFTGLLLYNIYDLPFHLPHG